MDDPSIEYYKALALQERKRADDNLRRIAELNNELGELREQLKAAWADIKRLRTEALNERQPSH
jgi:molecular chaperone GrpE (heat shock protein)